VQSEVYVHWPVVQPMAPWQNPFVHVPLLQYPQQTSPVPPHDGVGAVHPYQGDASAEFVQQSWPMSVGQSLSVEHVLTQLAASWQYPSQHSSFCSVLQSVDWAHAFGQVTPSAMQRPVTVDASRWSLSRAERPVQHVSFWAVLQSVDCVHVWLHAAVAVQIGWA
jgi:hypothetical protein